MPAPPGEEELGAAGGVKPIELIMFCIAFSDDGGGVGSCSRGKIN